MNINTRIYEALRDLEIYKRPFIELVDKYNLEKDKFLRDVRRYRSGNRGLLKIYGQPDPDFRGWKDCADEVMEIMSKEETFTEGFKKSKDISESLSTKHNLPYWLVKYQFQRIIYIKVTLEGLIDFHFDSHHIRCELVENEQNILLNRKKKKKEYKVWQRSKEVGIVTTKKPQILDNWLQKFIVGEEEEFVGMATMSQFRKLLDKDHMAPNYFPDVITFATRKSVLIFQTSEGDMPPTPAFMQFLHSDIKKVFFRPVVDLPKIANWCFRHGKRLKKSTIRVHEEVASRLSKFCKEFNLINLSTTDGENVTLFPSLVEKCLKKSFPQDANIIVSRWTKLFLTEGQRDHAANLALACYEIYAKTQGKTVLYGDSEEEGETDKRKLVTEVPDPDTMTKTEYENYVMKKREKKLVEENEDEEEGEEQVEIEDVEMGKEEQHELEQHVEEIEKMDEKLDEQDEEVGDEVEEDSSDEPNAWE